MILFDTYHAVRNKTDILDFFDCVFHFGDWFWSLGSNLIGKVDEVVTGEISAPIPYILYSHDICRQFFLHALFDISISGYCTFA